LASNELAFRKERVLASNGLVLDAIQGGAGIGKQCAGARRNYREEWVLASNELALGTTTGRSGYWQAMSWRWTQNREERVLASNALVLLGYKHSLARVRA
jgi:hypothetical protein